MEKINNNKVIMMLSGGRDSFLSACRLLDDPNVNYYLMLVTFDNGCIRRIDHVKTVADMIIQKYGSERVKYLGVYKIENIVREFFPQYFNMTPTEQAEKYYGLTPSQFHCLVCRSSMYIHALWLAHYYDAHFIAEGGRRDQGFVIELPGMIHERFRRLVESEGFELLLPVYELNDNWQRDNELGRRGYLSKVLEAKCIIGFPLNDSINESVIKGVHAYYDKVILPTIRDRGLLLKETYTNILENPYDNIG